MKQSIAKLSFAYSLLFRCKKDIWSNRLLSCICTFLFLTITLVSCRKTDTFNSDTKNTIPVNTQAVEKFLTVPENAGAALKGIIADLRKAEQRHPFLTQQIIQNGMPDWSSTISSSSLISSLDSKKTLSESTPSVPSPLYFIPFQDPANHEVKAFLLCAKTGDSSYKYQLYNKNFILHESPNSENALQNGVALLSVFATFENRINQNHTMTFNAPYSVTFKDADIKFLNTSLTNTEPSVNSTHANEKRVTYASSDCWVFRSQTLQISLMSIVLVALEEAWWENICTGETEFIGFFPIGGSSGGGGGNSGGGGGGNTNPGGGSGGFGGGTFFSGGGYTPPDPGTGNSGSGSGPSNIQDSFIDPSSINKPIFWLYDHFGPLSDNFLGRDENAEETINDQNTDMTGADYTNYGEYNSSQTWPNVPSLFTKNEFIGWRAPGIRMNCLDYANAQMALRGCSSAPRETPGQYWQLLDKTNTQNPSAAREAVNAIIAALQASRPVLVGVQAHGGPHVNADEATDHFIVITGSGVDANGNKYFTFYDNAANNYVDRDGGANPDNKLYWDETNGTLQGSTHAKYSNGSSPYYKVTQVRKTRKP